MQFFARILDSNQRQKISQSYQPKKLEYEREAEAKRDLLPRDDTMDGMES
ncbi:MULTISPECIES: hypothetical protein [unclassified Helicobacter]|nr:MULTISPECIES: hypothetical protein [unclassified Helicobacter]